MKLKPVFLLLSLFICLALIGTTGADPIEPTIPIPTIRYSMEGCPQLDVYLYGDSYMTAYDWDYGDGTIHGSEQNVMHTYANPGTYTVTLTETDSGGTGNTSIAINTSEVMKRDFSNSGFETGDMSNWSSNGLGWPYYGGNPFASVVSTHSQNGTYSWKYSASARLNGTFYDSWYTTGYYFYQNVDLTNANEIDFWYDITNVTVPSSGLYMNYIEVMAVLGQENMWSRYNPSTTAGWQHVVVPIPHNSYGSGNGTQAIAVVVRTWNRADASGDSGMTVYFDDIHVNTSSVPCVLFTPPVVDFVANVTTGDSPLTVLFTDSTGDSDFEQNYWTWYFDDFDVNSSSEEQNPVVTFNDPGVYNITLITGNFSGETSNWEDSLTKIHYINVTTSPLPPIPPIPPMTSSDIWWASFFSALGCLLLLVLYELLRWATTPEGGKSRLKQLPP